MMAVLAAQRSEAKDLDKEIKTQLEIARLEL